MKGTNESLGQHLAEKVMGWKEFWSSTGSLPDNFDGWTDDHNVPQARFDRWYPDENIEQAFMCLDTFEWFSICKNDDEYAEGDEIYSCEVSNNNQVHIRSSLPMAISLACARATGYPETVEATE